MTLQLSAQPANSDRTLQVLTKLAQAPAAALLNYLYHLQREGGAGSCNVEGRTVGFKGERWYQCFGAYCGSEGHLMPYTFWLHAPCVLANKRIIPCAKHVCRILYSDRCDRSWGTVRSITNNSSLVRLRLWEKTMASKV